MRSSKVQYITTVCPQAPHTVPSFYNTANDSETEKGSDWLLGTGPGPQADKSPSGGLGGVARTEGSQEGVAGGVARIMSPETMGIKV